MNILVTGGAGYIGSVLVPMLLQRGHAVTVLDNFLYWQTPLLEWCHHPSLTIVRGDARDWRLLIKLMARADVIIPLACLVGAPLCDKFPQEAKSVNTGAIKLLLFYRRKDQRILFPNTNSGYGIGESGVFCTEESPLRPVSLYGRLKVEAEDAIMQDGNAIVLRLATTFGISPRMRLDLLVNDFVYRAVTDGFVVLFEADFKRNYIHVSDVARAFVHCIQNFGDLKDEVYNVGLSDANVSKRELCEEIKKAIPNFYFIEADVGEDPDKRNYIVSNEKFEKTGFKPLKSLSDGIHELIKGFQIVRRNQFANV